MRVKLVLICILVVALTVFLLGCPKTTGGGGFIDENTGDKITFGFNAQPVGAPLPDGSQNAKGQFELIDHTTKINIHGDFTITDATTNDGASIFAGNCSVNGVEGYTIGIAVTDNGKPGVDPGDYISVEVSGPSDYSYSGYLQQGNIKVHAE
jgi:hypothetical protein